MTQKTNAARLLDQMGIRYELREYEVDPLDLAAEAVAAKIGLPPGRTGTDSKSFAASHPSDFLIANLELELELSCRNKSPLETSNRKYFAIFYPKERGVPLALSFRTNLLSTHHPSPATAFLIETPRLKIVATTRRSNKMQNSNRDKMRVLRAAKRNGVFQNHGAQIAQLREAYNTPTS
jgi:hypothetical protein